MVATVDVDIRNVDPVTFEIVAHRLYQITEEVGTTLERVGGTVNTTQMHDYMCALYRANGDILHGTGGHAACAGFAVKHIIEIFAADDGIEPGDIFVLNDPYIAAIHQSDVYVIAPIHYDDQLVAWSATFVHVMDIGALSPGGNSPGATHVCQEGVRISGLKLVDRGKLRRDVFTTITNMTRQPAMVGLDLKCEIAANSVARSRMQEMYAQYGPELLDAVSLEMIRYSEQTLRKRLAEIPDGSWTAEGKVEVGKENLTIRLRLDKEGDHLRFDFTGTDPQAKVGINQPYHATYGSCFGALSRYLGWDTPKNHGAFAPIEVICPPGTIMSAQYPAPISMATTAAGAVASFVEDAVMSQMVATSERWRTELMAKSMGRRRVRQSGVNQYGTYFAGAFGGLGGGGARPTEDGIDTGGGGTSISNIEWLELNFPLLYLFRRHTKDGPGPGKFRGGASDEVAVVVHDAPEGRLKFVAYGVAGLDNAGHGLFGGYPSVPSQVLLYEGSRVRELIAARKLPQDLAELGAGAKEIGYSEFDLDRDGVFFLNQNNGGGFGDPLERAPEAVAEDVRLGLISAQAARDVYGVVVDGNEIDGEATEQARRQRIAERTAELPVDAPTLLEEVPGASVHPLRENLEVVATPGGDWVRCTRCGHVLSGAEGDWKQAAHRTLLPLGAAGPLFVPFEGRLAIEQLSCPSCGLLLDTEKREARPGGDQAIAD